MTTQSPVRSDQDTRIIAVEVTPPGEAIQTLMIAKMYGIRPRGGTGWGCFASQIRCIAPVHSDVEVFYTSPRLRTLRTVAVPHTV